MLSLENSADTIAFFPRLLALIYFFAFGAFLFQMKGLFGKEGVLPIGQYLRKLHTYLGYRAYTHFPSLFWFNASDSFQYVVVVLGTILSLFIVFGIYPMLLLPLVFVLYLSIVTTGQDFLSFGWETLLLEISYYAFLLNITPTPNLMIWLAANFLIFRFHFLAGAIKWLYGDPTWRSFTALCYHYETQPLPNVQAYFANKLPRFLQRFSTAALFFLEIIVPFGIFGPDWMRVATFCLLLLLQLGIWFTGNFSYLNHLTVVLITLLLPIGRETTQSNPIFADLILSLIGVLLIFVQVVRILYHFFPIRPFATILDKVWPFFLAHWHAIFAHMTTTRYEVVVEGSLDGQEWKEYGFYYKPTELDRRPRRVSPYQPRLDWMLWFLPFTTFEDAGWFQRFLRRLLEGREPVLSLIRVNPFEKEPPKYVRSLLYIYRYTDTKTLKKTGRWWKREFVKEYSYPLSLADFAKE